MFVEKRKAKRAEQNHSLETRILLQEQAQGVDFEVPCNEVLDVSDSGIRVSADAHPSAGSQVKVMLKLPRGETRSTISLNGQVSWSEKTDTGAEIGIKLTDRSSSDIQRWRNFVKMKLPTFF